MGSPTAVKARDDVVVVQQACQKLVLQRGTKRNKPNAAKAFDINGVQEKCQKQTQMRYPTWYQWVTAILSRFFD